MELSSLGGTLLAAGRTTLACRWVRRALLYLGLAALLTAAVLVWNTYHVAINGGWNTIANTLYKPVVAYPGYTAIPQTFWAVASFAMFYALGYWLADGRWSAPLALVRFPLSMAARLKSTGRSGTVALLAGFALGVFFGQWAVFWTAGAIGMALLLLAGSRYVVYLSVWASLLWGFAKSLRDAPRPILPPALCALGLTGAGLGCLALFLTGLRPPVWVFAALAASVALLFSVDPRARALVIVGGGASALLLGMLESAEAFADDATFYEKNMTYDGVRKWSSLPDSGRLIDSSWDASRGTFYGGLPGAATGDGARNLESDEPDDELAERTYREMMGGTPGDRPPPATTTPEGPPPRVPFDRELGAPGRDEAR
jgi:hypothetical protein